MLNAALKYELYGNTVLAYGVFLAILLGGLLSVWLLNRIVLSRLKDWADKTHTSLDNFLIASLQKAIVPLLCYGGFMVSVQALYLNPGLTKVISYAGAILLTLLGIRFATGAIRFLLLLQWKSGPKDPARERQIQGFMPIVLVVVWVGGALFLLDNLGFEITTMIAGLGIGGVAVALASQAVLGDLFSYFSIMFDRPFEIGDFIILGDFMGSVEHIGIKTTRIRSLGGEQLVFSNTDLTSSRVRNYKRMEIRRVVFRLGVTYDTPLEKLKTLPPLIKEIITGLEKTRFDRAHFFSFGDFNLVIEAVYYVLSSNYNVYMDTQQAINFAIKEAFEQRGVAFAFPTQTIHLNGAARSERIAL